MVAIKSLVFLAPFVFALASASNDHNVNTYTPYKDNSQSFTSLQQGAYMGCGMARRQASIGNVSGNGNNLQNAGCKRSELLEEHLETRDLDAGYEALDAMARRSNDHNVSTWSPYTDNSRSSSIFQGGAVMACRRQSIGNVSGNGNNLQNACRRSTELAIKDVGAVYRRMVERDLTPEQAEESAEFLRRHAEELGLLEA